MATKTATLDLDPIDANRLIGRSAAARLLGMNPHCWDQHWRQYPRLSRAARATPSPKATGKGTPHRKWPLHVLLTHIERDLRI